MNFAFVDRRDIEEYERGLKLYLEGKMPEARFTPFRLQMGIYGQRQEGVQMVRIKVPGGVLSADQLRVVGEICDRHAGRLGAPKLVHVTTRQDLQMHFVALEDTPAILRRLADAGLTTREACGNTVRNVTSCFLAGRCPAARADASVHARAFAQHFLRHPLAQHFPRKFKVSFSGCAADCAGAGMHDIGFIAKEKDGRRGFEVWAAGGLSVQPMGAILVEEFVPEERLFLVAEALMRIHFYFSDRKRRARARMKYVAAKLGREGFLAEYRRQLAAIERAHARDARLPDAGWRTPEATLPEGPHASVRQPDGLMSVFVRLFRGDLTPAQCAALADAARDFGSGALLTTPSQNVVVPDVPEARVEALRAALAGAGLAVGGVHGVRDVVVCPGVESCRLAITSSRGLARALADVVDARAQEPALAPCRVHISGCQHSCGQHHVADFGLHGLARKIAGRAVPHYQLHLGGSGRAGRGFGLATAPVPAAKAPEALAALMDAYARERADGEDVRAWAERVGEAHVNAILAPFAGGPDEVEALVRDWDETQPFSTKDNKPGECAAAVIGMTDATIAEAQYHLRLSGSHLENGFVEDAVQALETAAAAAARAWCIQKGEVPEQASEALAKAIELFAADAALVTMLARTQAALARARDDAREAHAAIRKLVEHTSARLGPLGRAEGEEAHAEEAPGAAARDEPALLDLTGVACPMNFVKTKVRLAQMPKGARLAVILDDGEPIANVPASLEQEGQKVLARERLADGRWRIVVERRV